MYSVATDPPQRSYLEALEEDAEALHRRLLLEIATAFARRHGARRSPGELTRELLRASLRELLDLYGRDRWPLSWLWRRYFQALRRRLRARRGLPPEAQLPSA
jgi:hypothetical protein